MTITIDNLFGVNHEHYNCVIPQVEVEMMEWFFLYENRHEALRFFSNNPDFFVNQHIPGVRTSSWSSRQIEVASSEYKVLKDSIIDSYTIESVEMLLKIFNRQDRQRMSIYAPPGSKIFFDANGGTRYDVKTSLKELEFGKEYTVNYIYVGRSASTVLLVEKPNHAYNTCLFGTDEPVVTTGYLKLDA